MLKRLLDLASANKPALVKVATSILGALIGVVLVAIRENAEDPIDTTIELVSTQTSTEDLTQ